jgi:hypothetical protein
LKIPKEERKIEGQIRMNGKGKRKRRDLNRTEGITRMNKRET